MPRFVPALLLASAALLLPACSKKLASNSLSIENPPSVHVSGPAIDIHNFRGSVDIRVKPWIKTIALSYEVHADSETKDADAARAAVNVHAEMDATSELPLLVIRSSSTRETPDHSVHLRVDMPACSGVRVINTGGQVVVHDASGAVQIENHAAPIEVKTSHPLDGPVALSTSGAAIYLRAPTTSTAAVDAESTGGHIVWEAMNPATRVSAFRATPSKLSAKVNDGENAVLLRTSDADIHISFLEDPIARVVRFK